MPQIEGGTDVTVGPDLIVRRVDDSTGYMYERSGSGYHFDAGAEAVISFTVYPWVQVTRVDDLIIDMRAAGGESYPPTLALWNWESGAWDELDFNSYLNLNMIPGKTFKNLLKAVDLSGVYKYWIKMSPETMEESKKTHLTAFNKMRKLWFLKGYMVENYKKNKK